MGSAATTIPAVKPLTPGLPPGPRWPSLAQSVAWAVALPWMLEHCRARYGEIFTLKLAGQRKVVVSSTEGVKTVFTAPPGVAPSGARTTVIAPVAGPSSVLTLTGPEHIRIRRLLLPPFHGERMREYEQVILDATRRSMSHWSLDKPVRTQDLTQEITLEVMLRAVFGVEQGRTAAVAQTIGELFKLADLPVALVMALHSPTSNPKRPGGRVGRTLDNLDRVIHEEIALSRADIERKERGDILSLLLQARDEDGRALTDSELRDELVTLLFAGHETTATSITWTIERLIRHPDKLQRLIEEIDAGESDEYLQAVIYETLRLRPVIATVVRILEEPLQVGEYRLPPGTHVSPSLYLTNRDPQVYEEPAEFIPERFIGKRPETFSWIPFGGGIRRCLGASFALLEMKLVLSTVLSELYPSLPRHRGRRFRKEERILLRATLVPWRGGQTVWSRRRAIG
jgi:cytochrome P450